MFNSKFSASSAAAAASMLVASAIEEPAAALSLDQTSDIAAGMAAFGARARLAFTGPTSTKITQQLKPQL